MMPPYCCDHYAPMSIGVKIISSVIVIPTISLMTYISIWFYMNSDLFGIILALLLDIVLISILIGILLA